MRLATRTGLAAFAAATLSLLLIGVLFQGQFTRILLDRIDAQLEERAATAPILAAIATGAMALTHEALDTHPRPRAADHVRQMLVAHGALAERNEDLARLERWIDNKLPAMDRPDDVNPLRRFATWHTLRTQRRRGRTHLNGQRASPQTVE